MAHAAFALIAFLGACASGAQAAESTLVVAGQLLDVRSGHYLRQAGVLISGDRITEVGPAAELRVW
jgi:hypothetical protein